MPFSQVYDPFGSPLLSTIVAALPVVILLGALGIFAFMQTWAAFIWPLIITSNRQLWTMELGLGMFQFRYSVELGPINAGSMLSILPTSIAIP